MTAMPSICAAAQDFYIVSVKWLIHLPRPLLKIQQHGDIDLAPKGGEIWHRNKISFLPSGWFLRWR
jgi:hypothetical protein